LTRQRPVTLPGLIATLDRESVSRAMNLELLSTLKTNPVRTVLDRENAAHVAMMTRPEGKLENPSP
jgi:hypothetical protein